MEPVRSAGALNFEITEPELEAGQSLTDPRPRLECRASDAAPLPPAVKALVDAHAKKDWCGSQGSEWVPEGLGKVDWSDACRTHDECYGTLGANKFLCDYSLQQDMSLACAAQDGGMACHLMAGIYFEAVQHVGGEAYERAQAEAAKANP